MSWSKCQYSLVQSQIRKVAYMKARVEEVDVKSGWAWASSPALLSTPTQVEVERGISRFDPSEA